MTGPVATRIRVRTVESLGLALAVSLVEALDAATGIDQLLLASEKWVALVTQFDLQVAATGRLAGERVAAAAANVDVCVIGMDCSFHSDLRTSNQRCSVPGHQASAARRGNGLHTWLFGDFVEEFIVRAEGLQPIDEQLQPGGRVAVGGQATEHPAQLPDHL